MVRLAFTTEVWETARNAPSPRLMAVIEVEGTDLRVVQGMRNFDAVASISVVDPDSGRQLTLPRDGEAWALLLPSAFRSGDMEVEAVEMLGAARTVPAAQED